MFRNRRYKVLIVLVLLVIFFTGQVATRPSVTINQADASPADTTNASTINFTVIFSEPTTDFASGDVTLSGTAGATTAIVTGSGTTYNIAVSGMASDGTVIADIPAGVAHDSSNNANIAATFSDNSIAYDTTGPTVTINQTVTLQTDPTSASTINFTVVFNEPTTDFASGDVTLSGTAGATTATVTGSGTTYYVSVSGMTGSGTVIAGIAEGVAHDAANNANIASVFIDNTVTYDITAPTVANNNLVASYSMGPNSFTVTFSEDVNDPTGNTDANDVTNPANHLIVEAGENKIFDTTTCGPLQSPNSGRQADDIQITVNSVSYNSSTFTSTVIINSGIPLPDGNYRLFVCGTALILDQALNTLAGNGSTTGTDFIFDFTVNPTAAGASGGNGQGGSGFSQLPDTGFAPNVITQLPAQPVDAAYTDLDSLWLEIPSHNIKTNIVGVPQADNAWDVKWLGTDVGWLNGTAFPSWEGNSVLTGHVINASGLPGPFANIKDLKPGDQIIVHLFDQQYTFEVRITRMVRPYTTNYALKHLEGNSFLTLITCEDYNPFNDTYLFRRIIRAELVGVK